MIGLVSWDAFSTFGLVILFALVGFTVGNLISHTVSATILMPIAITLIGTGVSGGAGAVVPILVIGIIVSFSMILPISTPPNAIALSTGLISTKDLAKAGVFVGILGFAGTLIFGFVIWPLIL
jgi:sodium-dependent dicarboxylate transporter 2/3/5